MEEGLAVKLDNRPQMAWIIYQRVKVLSAMVEFSTLKGEMPLPVTLDGRKSCDPNGAVVKYVWDLGDGATAEGPTAKHTFQTPGTYAVKLTVANDKGASDTRSVNIIVTPVDATPPELTAVRALNRPWPGCSSC